MSVSLAALAISACMLTFGPRPSAAAETVLQVRSPGSGMLTYTTSKAVFSADELETIRFRWRTTCPGATGGGLVVTDSTDISYGAIVAHKTVPLDPNATYSTFDLSRLRTLKKFKKGHVPHGRYYVLIVPISASGEALTPQSNFVTIECRAPILNSTPKVQQKIGPVGKSRLAAGWVRNFQPQTEPARKSYKSR